MSTDSAIDALLASVFGADALGQNDAQALIERLLATPFGRKPLQAVHDFVAVQSAHGVEAVLELPAPNSADTMGLMAQLHGNEPAGLAAIALAMVFYRKGWLKANVYAILGTPLAAKQYFAAWAREPQARQETRDMFRRGLDAQGNALRDPNRIPADFRDHPQEAHNARTIALEALAERFTVTLDIHSARGDLVCITEYTELKHLLHSPIRNVLSELAGHIGAQSQACTFKSLLLKKPRIRALTGIEAGRHEDPASPARAMAFTHALMFNLGLTDIPPTERFRQVETGEFPLFQVGDALNFSQLTANAAAGPGDVFHTVRSGDDGRAEEVILHAADGRLSLRKRTGLTPTERNAIAYSIHQFAELEEIQAGQLVAVAVPSGVTLTSPGHFHALFVAKPAALYADKAAGVLPVAADALQQKFCYPCTRRMVKAS